MLFAGLPLSQLLAIGAVAGALTIALYILKMRRRAVAVPFAKIWARLVLGRERVQTLVEEGNGVLIDARVAPRYEGVSEPVDARPGHIPRAVNVPYTDNLVAPGGVFRDVASLRARYRAAGVQMGSRVAVYCGSGVTACHDILALGLIGIEGQLYDGSYSDWLSDPELDVNTGREPLPPSRGRWFFGGFRRGAARSSSGG